MKRFTTLLVEHSMTSDKNPGNGILSTGVANHYTPIENIITNVKNLFAVHLGVVVGIGEDNVSLKLHSSKFVSSESIDKVLYEPLFNDYKTLDSYIREQGLTKMTKVNLGMYYVVYYSPEDIKTALSPVSMEPNAQKIETTACCPIPKETKESLMSEFELSTIINEDDEEEMKSETVEKVLELLDGPDKVKAAKQLEILVSNEISLPREYYFAAVKFKSGEEAIALRWKYTKKMPFGKAESDGEYKEITVENVRSIMHIFGKGEQAIWVQDFDKESLVKLPDEVKKLIENILDLLEADETDNPAIFKLTGERKERKDKDKDKDDEDNDQDDDNKDDDKDEDDIDNDRKNKKSKKDNKDDIDDNDNDNDDDNN